MEVLVTGGAGFVGSNLTHALTGEGHAVRVLDDLSTGSRANLDGVDAELVEGSVTDPEAVGAAVDGCEVVFHQAAVPSVSRSVADPLTTHRANAGGALQVLIAARDAGVRRVVYASSSSVYGDITTGTKREDMMPRPRSPYAVAKLAGEQYCTAFTAVYGLETVCLRYFNIYGPRQDPASAYAAVVPKFVTAALTGESPRIDGTGEQTRDFTFVADAVRANLLAAGAGDAAVGESFNVGCGRATSVLALWELIAAHTGAAAMPVHGPGRAGDILHSQADVSKAGALLGYAPAYDLEAGVEATVRWFADRPASEAEPTAAAG